MDCPFANASLVRVRDMVASVAVVSVAAVSGSRVEVAWGWAVFVDGDVQEFSRMESNVKLINTICLISNFLSLLP